MLNLFYSNRLQTWPLAWQGIFWKVVSSLCFALLNCIVRYLRGGSSLYIALPLPTYVLDFFQNLFAVLVLLPWLIEKRKFLQIPQTPGLCFLHATRVITGLLGVGAWYFAFHYLPVAQCLALNFLGPIFTALGAAVFLKEKLGKARKFAILISFGGAFLVNRPDLKLGTAPIESYYTLFPILAAFCFAITNLLSRKLSLQGESPERLTLILLVWTLPLSLLPASQTWITPTMEHWPWLLLLGALAALAHFAYNKAYALAEVSFLLPFGFCKYLASISLAYWIFGEFPYAWEFWLGSAIMLLSLGLLSLARP
ncbi:MAG: DMT family transporter [Gammaproteobacteria bacterium]